MNLQDLIAQYLAGEDFPEFKDSTEENDIELYITSLTTPYPERARDIINIINKFVSGE